MDKKKFAEIESDSDGLKTYEYLVNHLNDLTDEELTEIIDKMARLDHSGQYLASGIKYMNGLDHDRYAQHIKRMTSSVIDRDREHKYIGDLISLLYGADYYDRVPDLLDDNNFRRMYKRLFPDGAL